MPPIKLAELPIFDRPREKLMRYGPDRLTTTELLAILIGTGQPHLNVLDLARQVLMRYGSRRLSQLSASSLARSFGLGPAKAARIIAALEFGRRLQQEETAFLFSPRDVWLALADIRRHKKEHFIVFYLDSRYKVLNRETISVGTINTSLVHPREVYEPAIRLLATHIMVAHNHPSGDPMASAEDLAVTLRLAEAGAIIGVPLLDHIIVTDKGYHSLKKELDLPERLPLSQPMWENRLRKEVT